jgi:signal transduction histidine kinase/CheY-like chemotaxis protein/HPt (histidine-containing phosphotransfer) domain-containing protein
MIKKIWKVITRFQVVTVFLAFAVMVISSYLYVSDIERKNLQKSVKDVISYTEANIKAVLLEPETILAGIAQTIQGMILRGDDIDAIQEYVHYINYYVQENKINRLSGVIGFYGLFDAFGQMFITGDAECITLDEYTLHDCPWYQAAVDAGGEIGVTSPYISMESAEDYMTFSRRIFDEEGRPLGVVCLDINLDRIKKLTVDAQFTEDGFGLMFNDNLEIIAHPDPMMLGMAINDVHCGMNIFEKDVRQYGFIHERVAVDYRGIKSIFYIEKLYNGWYMGVVTPRKQYYQSTNNMAMTLIILGLILSGLLMIILLRISGERNKANERTRVMIDTTPLSVSFFDRNYNLVDCNQDAVKTFEMADKREYCERFYDLAPEYQPDGKKSREKVIELLKMVYDKGYYRFEWMHQKLNGEPVPCEITLVRVEYKNDFIVLGYARDLRELKTTIAQMNESKRSLSTMENILNGIDASIYVTIPETCEILFINNYMKKQFKVESDGVGQYCYKVFADTDKQCDFCPCYKLDKNPNSVVIWERQNPVTEQMLRCMDRYIEWYDGRIVHIHHDVDLTELITAKEQAEQSSRFKTQFLSRMSHEVRTPMNAILGITEIQLQNETLQPDVQDALSKINNSSYLLLGIINDILDLSKIETGKLELTPLAYDTASLINDIVNLNIVKYDSKPVKFNLQIDENIPITLIGDELRIKQILNNLLSNAFKYTDKGEITMSVTIEYQREDASMVTLIFSVADTGQGMTNEQIEMLFDEYSRFNMAANRKVEGAGLGMSITKHLIKLMDGDISVKSEPAKGSAFTVRLPQEIEDAGVLGAETVKNLVQFHQVNKQHINKTSQITREYMPYGKVLIVDDMETNLYVARGLMSPYCLSIETALSGDETIEKIKSGSVYDIIFMDHFMPKMDGIDTTKVLRELGYDKPIIALTANALTGMAEMFLENGFDGFIAKPIDIRQLNSILNKFVRDKYPPEVIKAAQKQAALFKKNINKEAQLLYDDGLKAIFARDGEKAIARMNMIHRNSYRRADDIRQFVIDVHAMKSALASIGETDLSAVAFKLEQAGRVNEMQFIRENTPAFLEELSKVVEKCKPKEDDGAAVVEDSELNLVFLSEKLYAIQIACEVYDDLTANIALAELGQLKWSLSVKKLLETISEYLLHSDFDEAAKTAGEYLKNMPQSV